ncbi:MAG: HEAT repeat domain-containing protein [Alphaproteobacteria bacterium]|nr:HEAT repeat domain-containing protein [Alphaproteobacteria bacterium]
MSETSIVIAACLAIALIGLTAVRAMRKNQDRIERPLRAALRKRLICHLVSRSDDTFVEAALDGPGFLPVALQLLMQIEGVSRARLVEVMRRRNADSRLQRRLRRSSHTERLAAAKGLRFFPSRDTNNALLRALHDPDVNVQLAAAESLFSQESPPPLAQILAAFARTGRRQPARLDPVLRVCCEHHPSAFAAAAKAPEACIRAAALRALSKHSCAKSYGAVAQGLRDKSWFVRAAAADAAGRLGIYELVPSIIALVDDEHWWVRFRASEALEKLDSIGRNALRKIADRGSDRQRRQAALTLTKRVVV